MNDAKHFGDIVAKRSLRIFSEPLRGQMIRRNAPDALAVDRQFDAQKKMRREGHRRDAESKGHARPQVEDMAVEAEDLEFHGGDYTGGPNRPIKLNMLFRCIC